MKTKYGKFEEKKKEEQFSNKKWKTNLLLLFFKYALCRNDGKFERKKKQ